MSTGLVPSDVATFNVMEGYGPALSSWLADVCLHINMAFSCMQVSVSKYPLFIKNMVLIGLRPIFMISSQLITSGTTLFPNKEVLGIGTSICEFGGQGEYTIQYITDDSKTSGLSICKHEIVIKRHGEGSRWSEELFFRARIFNDVSLCGLGG